MRLLFSVTPAFGHLFPVVPLARAALDRLTQPPVVYCENYTGSVYLERQADVLRFRDALATLQAAAPDTRPSRDLLREIARSFAP